MLIIKTHKMFIKTKKKTKCGKRVYKKKYFTTVYQNGMKIGIVTKISISRGAGKLIEPIKPEDCLGYNKELHEFFKANPPIPIKDTNKCEVSEQNGMLKGGIRLYNRDDHGNLVRVTKEIQAELQNSYPENINPFRITPLPFREAGKSKDWLLEKIESATNDDIEPEYINNWIQTPSTIEVIDEQIKTK